MRIRYLLLSLALLIGCQAPCLLCKTPGPVVASLQGQVENLRVIEKDLVDGLEDQQLKEIWKNRLAAFIAESRSTLAWATKEDFDLPAALEEERKD